MGKQVIVMQSTVLCVSVHLCTPLCSSEQVPALQTHLEFSSSKAILAT